MEVRNFKLILISLYFWLFVYINKLIANPVGVAAFGDPQENIEIRCKQCRGGVPHPPGNTKLTILQQNVEINYIMM